MTLILKLNVDMVKMYLHIKNEVSISSGSKTQTDRHTDTQRDMSENITYPGGNEIKVLPANFGTKILTLS